jgi:hypothetical protein
MAGETPKEFDAIVSSEPFKIPEATAASGPTTLAVYQVVSSHANEAVSDAQNPVVVQHLSGQADLSRAKENWGLVHIPIHNPPTTNSADQLVDIIVKFDSVANATVDVVTLFFDNILVFHKSNLKQRETFQLYIGTQNVVTYGSGDGICLTLSLKFPLASSSIKLYSVSLVFKT